MGNMGNRPSIKVVDIFAGPGGLGEGFSSFIPRGATTNPFRIVRSAEKEQTAHKTLTLRAFYRRFSCPEEVPDEYYRIVRQEITPEDLKGELAAHWAEAEREALLLELGKESQRLHSEIEARIGKDDPWVLVGGPPCQAYSLVGRARNKGKRNYVAEEDKRHYLYREYLEILSRYSPPIFIMENVKGILTAKLNGRRIFPDILNDLHDPGRALGNHTGEAIYDIYPLSADAIGGAYRPGEPEKSLARFLVKAEDLGIPQARHRVILLGVRRGAGLGTPRPLASMNRVSVGQVVRDLPKIRSALSKGDTDAAWSAAVQKQKEKVLRILNDREDLCDVAAAILDIDFVEDASRMSTKRPDKRSAIAHQDWYHDPRLGVTLNHDSRGHMPADLGRYLYCAAYAKVRGGKSPTTKKQDFPKRLASNHKSWDSGKFANRFRVQAPQSPSATLVSHISKDGHYFIHPDLTQCRSYTVREAARAQTFPDNYFFMGERTAQYVQVGNAVPPLLARRIAEVVWGCMTGARTAPN
jgi:DNA (cytosine-5)-methyltransferase 1